MMKTCLSPNGRSESHSDAPALELFVATIRGLRKFERAAINAPWVETMRAIEERHISALLVDDASGLMFAGLHGRGEEGGLLVSRDGGATFELSTNGMVHTHVYTIAAQQRDGKTLLYAGVEPPALYRSDDLGANWHELAGIRDVPGTEKWTFPPPPHIAHVKNLAFHPSNPDIIYAAIEQGAVLKSEDNGQTWRELDSYSSDADSFYRDIHRIKIATGNPDHVHLTTGDGVYASDDAGEHWTHQQGRDGRVGYPDGLFIDPRNESTIYVGGAGDAPETWRVQGGSLAGFIVSHDRGTTWEERMVGLPEPVYGNLEAFAMHSYGDQIAFYTGSATGEVYGSEDAGLTWQLIAEGLPPISKARHYRHFLSAEDKFALEEKGREERRAEGLADKDYTTVA